ncbi:MAG TPA: aromatic ring-hydroxylating dioxygenase subunit alpha [Stellaceae bacterium]|nr:aromatic ring-hydroxylating dioxygenase subunit alpha [Stellaceae bacterium]
MNAPFKPPEARCPGLSYQDIIRRDGDRVSEVLALQANPPQPTADIPFARYTSKEFFALEMEKMWRKVWQFACRAEHLPETGDYYVYDIGRHSILITRAEEGLRAYHNSCLHRGTKLKPSGGIGWSGSIQCPFHGWHWNLDGSIRDIPCRWDFPHVDDEAAALRPIPVDTWNGCVFINMDRSAKPLAEYLEVVPEHWKRWDFTDWYVHTHIQKELSGNWKLAQEAFMEAYHTPVAHPAMTHVVSDINMQHDIFSDHVSRDLCAMASPSPTSKLGLSEQDLLDRMLVGDRSVVAERRKVPEGRTARWVMAQQMRETMAAEYGLAFPDRSDAEMIDSIKYNIFPNLFIYGSVGLPLIQQFRPHGNEVDRCLYDQMVLRPRPKDGSPPPVAEPVRIREDQSYTEVPGIDPFLASVLDQDTDIMRWQREGMLASEKGAETLSRYQESRIRHVHETLDKYLNA